jgi:hypothetical protein
MRWSQLSWYDPIFNPIGSEAKSQLKRKKGTSSWLSANYVFYTSDAMPQSMTKALLTPIYTAILMDTGAIPSQLFFKNKI